MKNINTVAGVVSDKCIARVSYNDTATYVKPVGEDRFEVMSGSPFDALLPTGEFINVEAENLLASILPSKVIGVGKNFRDTAEDEIASFPEIFLMPSTSVTSTLKNICLPFVFESVLAEGELAVVIKSKAKNIPVDDIQDIILGYTIVNDFSGRDSTCLEKVPALVKKGCDGFLPVGPFLYLDNGILNFEIKTYVNNDLKQHGNTKDLIFNIQSCLSYISNITTLLPGDIICLGCPAPKPKLRPGDKVDVKIENLGTLSNIITK